MSRASTQRYKRPALLSGSRPPTVKAKHAALSSKATRNLIRSHHRLLKARAQAVQAGDDILAGKIDAQIRGNGGLKSYQLASKLGQSSDRGGDSSRVLVDWMAPRLLPLENTPYKLRVLEIGALSTKNACSMNKCLEVTRIDLNSQEPGILKQDFMERPLPNDEGDRFHIISLSLVLNYVPDAAGRGDMLKRCVSFMTKASPSGSSLAITPSLFFVLPVACVTNSRYLTESRLQDIMSSMGFVLAKSKQTSKLIFQLWDHAGDYEPKPFRKETLNPGKSRNNFAIVVK
ncbi:25S rRNA (adenine2142-N1)-methyltransferase [Aspergillus ibericus CBS 121593]|uniref:25S rRNA adenine-N(1) methyltransferase n=1 Tax=Aspergillus ibericus CBS 121593 TaxID=1448316 RepID=A0A395HHD3_9EURO|nr:nucleolus protein [Aspergillus ibericus CBS 121593]RAL05654.1 nucleolus protein [Aspergillus ibericus CBS 121593]